MRDWCFLWLKRRMQIDIEIDAAHARRFHRLLRNRLARQFPRALIRLKPVEGTAPPPRAATTLLALERLVVRGSRETLCDPLPSIEGAFFGLDHPDIVVDLTGGRAGEATAAMTLRPLYDGDPSETAMIGALMAGRAPEISIERAPGQIVCAGFPSLEAADGLTGGMEAVYSRVAILLDEALRAPEKSAPRPRFEARYASSIAYARRGAKNLAMQFARALYHLCCYAPHWRVGWRIHNGPGVLERGRLDGPKWNVLADPGRRFFADPFPVTHNGRTYLFFEDLDHRIGKGIISAVEFGPHGPIGEIFPVLEEPWHLSYPFLIATEGQLWMIPESSKSGQVTLYRCVDFPGRWERCAALLENIEAADATVFVHDGLFYMMSAVREDLGGFSDTLVIHHAPALLGPWTEHALRPALIDASAARPAGKVVRTQGALWRPVQDCAQGYGHALRIARIDQLDPERFQQTFVARVGSGPQWPGGRLHTLNRVGALEVLDGVKLNPKFAPLRALLESRQEPRESISGGVAGDGTDGVQESAVEG
jgi:hypothetical protein